jgi:hypothetical protein
VALPLNNTFEGGTNTTAISAANSAGASGNAFDSVVGTAPTFSTTHAAHGTLAMTSATAAQSMVQWVASLGTPTEIWSRFYLFLTGNPSVALPVMWARDSTNAANASGLRVNTTSNPGVLANATFVNFTSVIPATTWVRVEVHSLITGGTTVTTDARYYATADSVTATETQTTGAVAQTISAFGAIRFGANLAQTNAVWMDDVACAPDGWIGHRRRAS